MTSRFSKLSKNITVDVAIIGGGLAGMSAAYFLSHTKKKTIVLEAETIGSGATSKTTAFITYVIDTDFSQLKNMFGTRKAKLVWESGREATDVIESVVRKEKIECDFKRCSLYIYTGSKGEFESLEEEYKVIKQAGFPARLRRDNRLGFKNYGYLEIPNQAKFSAEKFITALAKRAKSKGTGIYENTEVTKISGKTKFQIKTKNAIVTANQIIIATYDPLGNPKPTRFKKGMYKSYVFKLHVPKNKFPEAIYQDTHNPYHYFRIDKNNKTSDSMTIGGEDHRSELKLNPKKSYKALEQYLKQTFPGVKYTIKTRWTGPILEPSDGLPLIGEFAPNQFVTTAFSGNGMTYSIISALLLTDLISGKKNPWTRLYDPKRTPTLKQLSSKFKDYAGEFFGAAAKNLFK